MQCEICLRDLPADEGNWYKVAIWRGGFWLEQEIILCNRCIFGDETRESKFIRMKHFARSLAAFLRRSPERLTNALLSKITGTLRRGV